MRCYPVFDVKVFSRLLRLDVTKGLLPIVKTGKRSRYMEENGAGLMGICSGVRGQEANCKSPGL